MNVWDLPDVAGHVSVLGRVYEIVVDDTIIEQNVDGLHERHTGIIKVISEESVEPKDKPSWAKKKYLREILRHELFHAVFAESGMEKWEHDEDLVQFLASQFPKIARLFLECECAN